MKKSTYNAPESVALGDEKLLVSGQVIAPGNALQEVELERLAQVEGSGEE